MRSLEALQNNTEEKPISRNKRKITIIITAYGDTSMTRKVDSQWRKAKIINNSKPLNPKLNCK